MADWHTGLHLDLHYAVPARWRGRGRWEGREYEGSQTAVQVIAVQEGMLHGLQRLAGFHVH